jgi:hypothetical protein
MVTAPSWLERYRAGQREQVWREIGRLGSAIRDDAELLRETELVCDEMARRARRNVEMITGRLIGQGYRFHRNDDEQTPAVPWVPPTAAAGQYANWLTAQTGPVPLTVLSWIRIVGDVWLVGTHPQWPESAGADPLVIELEGSLYPDASKRDFDLHELAEWRRRGARESGPFELPVAPDWLHKAGVSGGSPYSIILPYGCADGLLSTDEETMLFVSYLNRAFGRGGFPRLTGTQGQRKLTRLLAQDILPL